MRSWGAPFSFSTSRHIGQTGPCLCITTSSGPGIPLPAHARAGVAASRRRRAAGFPTIGKIFRRFSNDWKKFSAPSPVPRHAATSPRPPFGRGRQTAESNVRHSKSITPASYRFPRRHRKGESSPRGKSRRGRAEARPSPRCRPGRVALPRDHIACGAKHGARGGRRHGVSWEGASQNQKPLFSPRRAPPGSVCGTFAERECPSRKLPQKTPPCLLPPRAPCLPPQARFQAADRAFCIVS